MAKLHVADLMRIATEYRNIFLYSCILLAAPKIKGELIIRIRMWRQRMSAVEKRESQEIGVSYMKDLQSFGRQFWQMFFPNCNIWLFITF